MVENNLEQSIKPDKELVVKDVETLKVLADPLHLQIMDLLCDPKTVKQIAKTTNLATTKLYYHIKQLEESGLIQVVSTRVVSGIIEKQYQVKALNIKIDQRMFNSAGTSGPDEEIDLVEPTFKRVAADIAASRQAGLVDRTKDPEGIYRVKLIRAMSRLKPEQVKKFNKRLEELVEEFSDMEDEDLSTQNYAFMSVFFPVSKKANDEAD